jgi:hypothetical protein
MWAILPCTALLIGGNSSVITELNRYHELVCVSLCPHSTYDVKHLLAIYNLQNHVEREFGPC